MLFSDSPGNLALKIPHRYFAFCYFSFACDFRFLYLALESSDVVRNGLVLR